MNTETKFSPKIYWQNRLTKDFSLSGAGYKGLGIPFNNWMYKLRKHIFLEEIKKFVKDPSKAYILDLGCGTGFLVELWKSLGVKNLEGVDITEVSIKNLRKIYPQYRFYQIDISFHQIFLELRKNLMLLLLPTYYFTLLMTTDIHQPSGTSANY